MPWDVSEVELQELVPTVRKVTSGYYTLECVSLGGLEQVLGFHFEPHRLDFEHVWDLALLAHRRALGLPDGWDDVQRR